MKQARKQYGAAGLAHVLTQPLLYQATINSSRIMYQSVGRQIPQAIAASRLKILIASWEACIPTKQQEEQHPHTVCFNIASRAAWLVQHLSRWCCYKSFVCARQHCVIVAMRFVCTTLISRQAWIPLLIELRCD